MKGRNSAIAPSVAADRAQAESGGAIGFKKATEIE